MFFWNVEPAPLRSPFAQSIVEALLVLELLLSLPHAVRARAPTRTRPANEAVRETFTRSFLRLSGPGLPRVVADAREAR
jgi:hypothetical protein